jgi:hypothetical protein
MFDPLHAMRMRFSRTGRMGTGEGYWSAKFISELDFGKMTGREAMRWLIL